MLQSHSTDAQLHHLPLGLIRLKLTGKKGVLNAVSVKSENTDLCIDIQCVTFQRLQNECVVLELENVCFAYGDTTWLTSVKK